MPDADAREPALALRGISKVYPGPTQALAALDLDLFAGEIVALCGENGAGKSTLATIAAGVRAPSSGSVHAVGTVGLVHQHLELVERLRVWENVVLGREPRCGALLDRAAARARCRSLSERFGLEIDPEAIVEALPVAIAQRVELLRELGREPRVLVLDEPTAVLSPPEIEALFATLRTLANGGTAILVITHKLGEVVEHADRATVLRAGHVVARFERSELSPGAIARAMVGGELPPLATRAATEPAPGLEIAGLRTRGVRALVGLDLSVRAGEILAIAGVEGNGQSALVDAIAGMLPYAGTMQLGGRLLAPGDPAARIAAGIRTIPQDRLREGLVLPWSLAENAALGDHARAPLARRGLVVRSALAARASALVARFDVRAASIALPAAALSGGNQQKVVVGRALENAPRVIVAYQPTRGVDVGAAALVQSRLIEARNAGAAILLVSFELDEIFALADRIAVLYRGRVAGESTRAQLDRARIGAWMAGAA